jgi:hypothetical protein
MTNNNCTKIKDFDRKVSKDRQKIIHTKNQTRFSRTIHTNGNLLTT